MMSVMCGLMPVFYKYVKGWSGKWMGCDKMSPKERESLSSIKTPKENSLKLMAGFVALRTYTF